VGWSEPVNAAEVVLVYVCIPGGFTAAVASLVFLPGLTRRPRYKPGEPWPHEPVFYGPHPSMLDEQLKELLAGGEAAESAPAVTARRRPVLTAGPAGASTPPVVETAPVPATQARGGAHGDW
jgi:hypothetical protein